MKKNNTIQLLIILFALIVVTTPYLWEYTSFTPKEWTAVKQAAKEKADPFKGLDIKAESVYVFDVAKGKVLFARNENTKLPLASLTKVMTAIVATDLVPQSTVVEINEEDVRKEGDSGLLTGEKWRMSDIIDFTLTTSSNDGASAIATVAGSLGQNKYGVSAQQAKNDFINQMNIKTTEIGLLDTQFLNETGLDLTENKSGAYGTAKEMALLMMYAIKNKSGVIDATSRDSFSVSSLSGFKHVATNTDKIVKDIPGLIASKTGFTDLAGGNLIIAFDAGVMRPIIISVLGSGIDSRFNDMEKLVNATMKSI